jgi:hypothetical protein
MAIERSAPLNELLPELGSAGMALRESVSVHEASGESEAMTDRFFGRLALYSEAPPALRELALSAGRMALSGLGSLPTGPDVAREDELEVSPLARVYPDQARRGGLSPLDRVYGGRDAVIMMERLARVASEGKSLARDEPLLGALVPLAASLSPRVAPLVVRATPGLMRGVTRVGRALLLQPRLRPLVRTLPTIMRRTVAQLARLAAASAAGRAARPTPRTAVRILASQTAGVLGNPHLAVSAWRRARAISQLSQPSVSICPNCRAVRACPCRCGCGAWRRVPCRYSGGCSCPSCRLSARALAGF